MHWSAAAHQAGDDEGQEEGAITVHVSCEIKITHKAMLWYVLKFKVDFFFSLDLVISYTIEDSFMKAELWGRVQFTSAWWYEQKGIQ